MFLKERILSFERVVTIAGKGRYAGSWHFFLVSTMFSKAFSVIVIKLRALSGKALTSNSMGEQQCQLRFTVFILFFFSNRKLPERIPIVLPVRVHTAPPTTILTDKHCNSVPLFQIVSSTSKTDQGKEFGRMHFIDKEWPSEKISWIRFNQNVPEIHRLGWIK